MTRTDVLTSIRQQETVTKSIRSGRSRRRVSLRGLLALPIALLLATVLVAPSFAATSTNKEGLSGYEHKTAKKEEKPAKNKEIPSETPATTPAPAKASTLPFTGFDLRWTVGFGLLLMVAGGSIVVVQRRERRSNGR